MFANKTIARVGRRPIKISTTSLSFNMIDIFYSGWRPQHRRGRCRRRYTTMILLLYGQRSLHTSALSHLLCALTLTLRWQSTTFCFQSHSWSWTEKARPGGHRRAWKKLSMIVKKGTIFKDTRPKNQPAAHLLYRPQHLGS